MTQLEKMIESCEVFEEKHESKTGNIKWKQLYALYAEKSYFTNIPLIGEINIWLYHDCTFTCKIAEGETLKLTATTAQEAAAEALELCKKEAQKLVELLGEPKNDNCANIATQIVNEVYNTVELYVNEWMDSSHEALQEGLDQDKKRIEKLLKETFKN